MASKWAALLVVAAALAFGGHAARAQTQCGAALLEGVPDRLRALESQRPATADDAVRRSNDLAAIVDAISGGQLACPGDSDDTFVKTLARARLLALWAKMIALDVDAPVYPAPYDRRCARSDGATAQLAFVRAYTERLAVQGTEAMRGALRQALDVDELTPHIGDLASQRAQRLRIERLPTPESDETEWLARTQQAQLAATSALPAGIRCGPVAGLWGL